jgi:hypothetical protein
VTAVVHLAGDQVTFQEVSRQRCLWCGALIDERDWAKIGLQVPAGMSAEVAFEGERRCMWRGFVGVEGNARWAVAEPEPGMVPANTCMLLDHTVTR